MASKHVKLLLTENVDNLGIVGDVVRVRLGYARNFLLPFGLATAPSEDLIKDLAAKRADAEKRLAALRKQREEMIKKLDGQQLTMVRACNDQGHLYGSVTQQDIADLLAEQKFVVSPRDVRIGQTIKRIGEFEITVKPERDLEAVVYLIVESDTPMEVEEDEPTEEALAEGESPEEATEQPAGATGA